MALRGVVEALPIDTLKKEKGEDRPEPAGEVHEWELSEGKKVKLEVEKEESLHQDILLVLNEKESSFAWSPKDILWINPEVMTHKLNVDMSVKSIKQKKRRHAPER